MRMSHDCKTLSTALLADYAERGILRAEFDFQKSFAEVELASQIRCRVLSFW
jgi:hypothetical protein